jgi:hypothetical protein
MSLKTGVFDSALAWARRNPAQAAVGAAAAAILLFTMPALLIVATAHIATFVCIAGTVAGGCYLLREKKPPALPAVAAAAVEDNAPSAIAHLPDLGKEFHSGIERKVSIGPSLKLKANPAASIQP